jgi:hypothetical protein
MKDKPGLGEAASYADQPSTLVGEDLAERLEIEVLRKRSGEADELVR